VEFTFFVAERAEALGVASWDDIPTDPIGDSVRAESPRFLIVLARLLVPDCREAVTPLSDATCRSFPVWEFDREAGGRLAQLSDEALEGVASAWQGDSARTDLEADLHELVALLAELRLALTEHSGASGRLYVLLEEKAF
jgi:hypothetical protein